MKSLMSPLVWSRMTATLRLETSGLVFGCLAGGFSCFPVASKQNKAKLRCFPSSTIEIKAKAANVTDSAPGHSAPLTLTLLVCSQWRKSADFHLNISGFPDCSSA